MKNTFAAKAASLVSADRLCSQHTLFLEVPTENDERFFWDVGRGVSSNRVGPHTLSRKMILLSRFFRTTAHSSPDRLGRVSQPWPLFPNSPEKGGWRLQSDWGMSTMDFHRRTAKIKSVLPPTRNLSVLRPHNNCTLECNLPDGSTPDTSLRHQFSRSVTDG